MRPTRRIWVQHLGQTSHWQPRACIYRRHTGNMTYIDVGTNIDARAAHTGGGRFLVYLNLERSWVEGDVSVPVAKSDGSGPSESSDDSRCSGSGSGRAPRLASDPR